MATTTTTANNSDNSNSNNNKRRVGLGWMRNNKKKKQQQQTNNNNKKAPVDSLVWHSPNNNYNNNNNNNHPKASSSLSSNNNNNSSNNSNNNNNSSWFTRTRFFRNLCDTSFDSMDVDHSGTVDGTELYAGLLWMHLKLGTYAGPAACRPLSRQKCVAVFAKFDSDKSGSLDRNEFGQVMMVLFSNVFLRVLVQWSMTLMIVPLMARGILNGISYCIGSVWNAIANLDEHSKVANTIELFLERSYTYGTESTGLAKVIAVLSYYGEKVPQSVWDALPLGLISAVLGIVIVPFCIFQVDDFFQRLAERKTKKNHQE